MVKYLNQQFLLQHSRSSSPLGHFGKKWNVVNYSHQYFVYRCCAVADNAMSLSHPNQNNTK